MKKFELSILIPARNEMWLARTVKDILENSSEKTEIIVGLDGQWADPVIPDSDRVTIVYYPESIGQRMMTNQLARISRARYVMKVDAHCSFDKGFDDKLLADMKDDWTMVPVLRNLHAFNWKCPKCGSEWYQGRVPTRCLKNKDLNKPGDGTVDNTECNNTEGFFRQDVWKPNRRRPLGTSFCFDPEPHFQYFNEYKSRQEGPLVETMSLQGSCFMMTREKYWELNICDEKFGSWGSQGIEVAVKTWLSGGRVVVNKNTWYAHLFRTQGGDADTGFGFPYHQSQSKIDEAKKRAKDIFLGNKWDKQIHPLSWLIEKFWPIVLMKDGRNVGWTDEDLAALKESEKSWKQKV